MDGVSLSNEPLLVTLFLLFLIGVSLLTLARTAMLVWRLFLPFRRRLTKAALVHAIEIPAKADRMGGTPPLVDRDAALATLRAADAAFQYAWRVSRISVTATRGLVRLTLIATAFITQAGPADGTLAVLPRDREERDRARLAIISPLGRCSSTRSGRRNHHRGSWRGWRGGP